MWSSTSLHRIWVPSLKMRRTTWLVKLRKPLPWSSSEDIFMTHCKPSTLLRRIHKHYGSLWLIILITKMTSSWLKEDMTGSICASKTLSLWMNIILKFVESNYFSSFVTKLWRKKISWRRPIRPSRLLILSSNNNIELRSSLSSRIWSLFYLLLKSRTNCWWRIIKLDLLGRLMCLKHTVAQTNTQNTNIGMVGLASAAPSRSTEPRPI